MSTSIKLGSVSLDCAEPVGLAQFYASLLGVAVAYESEKFAAISLPNIWLSFQAVEDFRSPSWPDSDTPVQSHLDFSVTDLDLAQDHALSVGATKASVQPNPDGWRVLFDPSGHPFCLTLLIPELPG